MAARAAAVLLVLALAPATLPGQTACAQPDCIYEGDCYDDLTTPTLPTAAYSPQFLQAEYGSFGSRWGLKPSSRTVTETFGLNPAMMGHNPNPNASYNDYCYTRFPNTYSPLTTQAVYRDDLWDSSRPLDYAERTIYHLGQWTGAAFDVDAGDGLTRQEASGSPEHSEPNAYHQKYVVGEFHHGAMLRGGDWFDYINVMGSQNLASTQFYDLDDVAPIPGGWPSGSCPIEYQRIWANALTGSESAAFVGNRISADFTEPGSNGGPLDLRDASTREDQMWFPYPAIVREMRGSNATVWLDNKRIEDASLEELGESHPWGSGGALHLMETAPYEPGYIHSANALNGWVLAAVDHSWVNVGTARGLQTQLIMMDYLAQGTDGETSHYGCKECPDADDGGRIREYVGVDIKAPVVWRACNPTTGVLTVANPILWEDFGDWGGPGSGPEVASLVLDDPPGGSIARERHASILRGSVVVGDSRSEAAATGYDTDVLHVRDVLRLEPRTTPPAFHPDAPPSDRIGMVYYDAGRGTLRLSVPAEPLVAGADWRDAKVVWVDVALDWAGVVGATDVAGDFSEPSALRKADAAQVEASALAAADEAAGGASAFETPRISAVPAGVPSLKSGEPTLVTLLYSGFGGKLPRAFFKRIDYLPEGGSRESAWTEIGEDALAGTFDDNEAATWELRLSERNGAGEPPTGASVVKVMAIHPVTGQAAGTSFRLR